MLCRTTKYVISVNLCLYFADTLLTTHIFSKTAKSNEKHIETTKSKTYSIAELNEIRSALVNNITYSSLAVRYGLQKYLLSMSKPLLDMIDNFVVHQEAVEHEVVGHVSKMVIRIRNLCIFQEYGTYTIFKKEALGFDW
jgi:hypothetical protein